MCHGSTAAGPARSGRTAHACPASAKATRAGQNQEQARRVGTSARQPGENRAFTEAPRERGKGRFRSVPKKNFRNWIASNSQRCIILIVESRAAMPRFAMRGVPYAPCLSSILYRTCRLVGAPARRPFCVRHTASPQRRSPRLSCTDSAFAGRHCTGISIHSRQRPEPPGGTPSIPVCRLIWHAVADPDGACGRDNGSNAITVPLLRNPVVARDAGGVTDKAMKPETARTRRVCHLRQAPLPHLAVRSGTSARPASFSPGRARGGGSAGPTG